MSKPDEKTPYWIGDVEWKLLPAHARTLANELGLADWTVRVSADCLACDSNIDGQAHQPYGRKLVTIKLNENFPRQTPASKQNTLVHELLHCQTEPCGQVFRSMRSIVGESAWSVASAAYEQALEYQVDALAGVLAPLLTPYPKIDDAPAD